MRRTYALALTLGIMSLSASPARAQGMGGPGFAVSMLRNESVLSELNTTEEQKRKLQILWGELRDSMRDSATKVMSVDEKERPAAMFRSNHDLHIQIDKGIDGIFAPEQVRRFHEIQLQRADVQGFAMPHVETALKLTPGQKDKIRSITLENMERFRTLFAERKGGAPGSEKQLADLRKDSTDQAMKVLSDEQKERYRELLGKPFEMRPGNPG